MEYYAADKMKVLSHVSRGINIKNMIHDMSKIKPNGKRIWATLHHICKNL